jgi:glyoxylase-like metal-dependent hydrolase (beta-lactamase superfamily II)
VSEPAPPAPPAAAAVPVPAAGGVAQVAPGVLWVRLALPLALDHVNVWLLAERDGWTLVDTGLGNDATRAAWERLEAEVLGGRPLRRLVATHYHPDHVGLAGWLAARHGAELWSSQAEWLHALLYASQGLAEARASFRAFYRRAGVPARELPPLLDQARAYQRWVVDVPPSHRRLRDGAELDVGGTAWRVVVGRGHSPEHVCLHAPALGLLVSGDQVLPSITPNTSVWPSEPEADPVGDFLESVAALRRLPDDVAVLPSHGRPFTGLHRRLGELAEHHRLRLEEVLAACLEPRTAHEVTRSMFPRELDPHQTSFAIGEALGHLNHLVLAGHLRRERAEGAPDRFVQVA